MHQSSGALADGDPVMAKLDEALRPSAESLFVISLGNVETDDEKVPPSLMFRRIVESSVI